ncbi:YdeI/OmpD-associated family protein [Smaragdicoccus niigatensis]|uniref:YdeI/OmpD-associated family protein n=1 Tax=Smaragdicoccus niigatensis TaxID=359359 RepID=UPI0003764E1B|nr:YdeI/OmpD-associated family protein [Smaragdicoccus niigatensis]
MREGGTSEKPAIFFDDAQDFRAWLEANHESAPELWMGFNKKHVVPRGLSWEEAVPEALCFGWIDSLVQSIDENTRRQRWTPRRPTSVWSQINIDLVAELTAAGRMRPAGIAAFERRKAHKSGIYSYENGERELPPEYEQLLKGNVRAWTFWQAATASYQKQMKSWVMSAKQQATRDKRIAELVAESAAGQLVKYVRYGKEPAWVAKVRAELG